MTQRRVRFTTTAQEHVRREKTWWVENRTHTDIFATELDEAVKILAVLPGAGTSYLHADIVGLRRIYLRRVACITPSASTRLSSARYGEPDAARGPSSNRKVHQTQHRYAAAVLALLDGP